MWIVTPCTVIPPFKVLWEQWIWTLNLGNILNGGNLTLRLLTQSLKCNITWGRNLIIMNIRWKFHCSMKECSSKTLVTTYHTTWCHILGDHNSRNSLSQNLNDAVAYGTRLRFTWQWRALEREFYKMLAGTKTQIGLQSKEEKEGSSVFTEA
jgi:hypothetical protein